MQDLRKDPPLQTETQRPIWIGIGVEILLMAVAYFSRGSFFFFLCFFFGIVMMIRGMRPATFARHFDAQLILGISYRRRESLRRWGLAVILCFSLAEASYWIYGKRSPSEADLTRLIINGVVAGVRELLQSQTDYSSKKKEREIEVSLKPSTRNDNANQNGVDARAGNKRRLTLYFKYSPLFTAAVKDRTESDLTSFTAYLSSLGLAMQSEEVPPITIANGAGFGYFGNRPVVFAQIHVTAEEVDNRPSFTYGFCEYVIHVNLAVGSDTDSAAVRHEKLLAGADMGLYLVQSYWDQQSPVPDQHSPVSTVLWKIRERIGKRRTDQIVAKALSSYRSDPVTFPETDDENKWIVAIEHRKLLDGCYIADADAATPLLNSLWAEAKLPSF